MPMPEVRWTHEDDEGYEVTTVFPATFEVCDRCRGTGTQDHPAFSNGITSSEWAEWDDDDREHYLEGRYDVPCSVCGGDRVVPVIDEDRCDPDKLAAYHEYQSEMAEYRAICAAERRMGA